MGKKPLTKEQIDKIIELRRHGYSLPEIRKVTAFGGGTIFKYIQGIEILPDFLERWQNRKHSSVARMMQNKQKARVQARHIIKRLSKAEKAIITSCLYWAEGQKRDFSLSNTDPALIKVFVECLKEFGVQKDDLKITIRVYEDLKKDEICTFWSDIIGIPKDSIINVNVLEGKKKGKLKYGMCRVRVRKGGYLLKLLHAIKETIFTQIISPHSSTDRTRDS